MFFGGLYQLDLYAVLCTTDSDAVFVRIDLYTTPDSDSLTILDENLAHVKTFRMVLLIHGASSPSWNTWVARWESRGRSFLAWASDTIRMRMYDKHVETEVWRNVDGPWKLHMVDSGVKTIGTSVERFTNTDAVG